MTEVEFTYPDAPPRPLRPPPCRPHPPRSIFISPPVSWETRGIPLWLIRFDCELAGRGSNLGLEYTVLRNDESNGVSNVGRSIWYSTPDQGENDLVVCHMTRSANHRRHSVVI